MTAPAPGVLTLDQLKAAVASGEIDTVVTAFPDMLGRLMGKRLHGRFFVESGWRETHCCNYLLTNDVDMEVVPGYAAANWEKGYGDFTLKPDLTTLRRIDWLPKTALVICDLVDHHGAPIAHSPRAILRRQIARLKERGWIAHCATELEFYLFDTDYRAAYAQGYRDLKASNDFYQDYNILLNSREEAFMRPLRNHLVASGLPVECTKGEWGKGQGEINLRYDEALITSDWHAIMKNGAKEIAQGLGKSVTFMPKPFFDQAGSSSHIHLSLADAATGRPVFVDERAPDGMSPEMRAFLAGQLRHAAEYTFFLAPNINSYKRFQPGAFAPTRILWSRDNRTAGFRVVGEGTKALRFECRIGGSDLNPYLALAALIAAGLAGIEESLTLPPAFVGDGYAADPASAVPSTLREARARLAGSQMLKAAFGADVVAHYLRAADWEQSLYDSRITDWELTRNFERA